MTFSNGRPRWGDDDLGEEDALPPREETQVDENGIKHIVEFYRNEKGQTVKKTSKIRVVSIQKKVYKISQERKEWERFGNARGNIEGVTALSTEDIPFENIRAKTATLQQLNIKKIQQNLQGADNKSFVQSLGSLLQEKKAEREIMRHKGQLPAEGETAPEEAAKSSAPQRNPDAYVPPKPREQEGGFRRGNENSVRVTNLSDDVAEADLGDLFRPFGDIARIYLAVDKETGRSRGFAFINFVVREDAERAINALNGFGYSNLILHCEWAAPKERK